MRYFFSENAALPLPVNGRVYVWDVTTTFGGTIRGVIALSDDEAPGFIALTAKLGLLEITQAEYDEAIKKKRNRVPWNLHDEKSPLSSPTFPSPSPAVESVGKASLASAPMKTPKPGEGIRPEKAPVELASADELFPATRIGIDAETHEPVVTEDFSRRRGRRAS